MSSSLTRFFGSSRKSTSPRGSTSDDKTVISELQDSKELMDKRIEHLERKAEMEVEAALAHKKAGAKGKNAMVGCMKRKKMIDQELASLQEQRFKLDTHEATLSQLRFTETTFAVEQRATQAIKAHLRKVGGVEGMEHHHEATEDALADAHELLGMAAQAVSNPALDGADDDELLAELDDIIEAKAQEDARARAAEADRKKAHTKRNAELLVERRRKAEEREKAEQEAEQEAKLLAELERQAERQRRKPQPEPEPEPAPEPQPGRDLGTELATPLATHSGGGSVAGSFELAGVLTPPNPNPNPNA